MTGNLHVARITVEERTGDRRGPWNRFHDIKGIETKDAQDAIGAFPSEDGSNPAFPEREVTLQQLANVVKMVEGGTTLFSSPANQGALDFGAAIANRNGSITYWNKEKTRSWLANTSGFNSPQLWFQKLRSVRGIATNEDLVKRPDRGSQGIYIWESRF